jgi:hypothetical protein
MLFQEEGAEEGKEGGRERAMVGHGAKAKSMPPDTGRGG